ncbi:MAG: hypothetical protein SFY92_02395 [Verrucomicrobiae bacterium]|nr:hypothetical protein [Verrucomicrobiae bacterium]
MDFFNDIKRGFRTLLADPRWFPKILLAGFLLINPFLLAFAPAYFAYRATGHGPAWIEPAFYGCLAFNVLSFWFPLGFTFEVLRRARTGSGPQLPDWNWRVLPRYAREGAVKLFLSIFTLLLPVGLWTLFCHTVFIRLLNLPDGLLMLFIQPVFLLVIPFCGIACCRWLDGGGLIPCALNYAENIRLFKMRGGDFLIASVFLMGLNSVTTAFYYTLPFAAVFGLCLVDTWFGPLYAQMAKPAGAAQGSPVRGADAHDPLPPSMA